MYVWEERCIAFEFSFYYQCKELTSFSIYHIQIKNIMEGNEEVGKIAMAISMLMWMYLLALSAFVNFPCVADAFGADKDVQKDG